MGDFAVSWKLTVPASAQDEFITAEDLRRTDRLEGQLRVLVFLRPTHVLYTKAPGGMPVGVFAYNVSMNRIGDWSWRQPGPCIRSCIDLTVQ